MKIIGIGFHKTGTSTLNIVLRELGYNVLGARTDLAKNLFDNDFDTIFNLADLYDAYQDNPWPLLYKELDARYSNSKFILTVRDEDKWIKSVVNHFGKTHTEMRRWIYGIGYPKGNEDIYKERYRKHNQEVKEYFRNRENDLLVVSWENGDGWKKVCEFLNKPLPKKPFPHINRGDYSKKESKLKTLHLINMLIKRMLTRF